MPAGSSPADRDASPSIDDWAGPSRYVRAIAVVIAVVVAMLVFLVVNRVWRVAAPAPRAFKPSPVEVQLVGPSPPVSAASRR